MIMTFGRHKGKAVAKLPKGYCEWLVDNVDMDRELEAEVYRRLKRPLPPPPKTLEERLDEVVRQTHEDLEAGRIPTIEVWGIDNG